MSALVPSSAFVCIFVLSVEIFAIMNALYASFTYATFSQTFIKTRNHKLCMCRRFDQLLAINYYDASSSLYDYEEAQYARYRRQYMRRGVINKGICDNTVRYDKYQFAGNKRIKLLTMAEYTGDHVFCFESDGVTLTSAFWNLNLDVDWYEYDYNVNLSLTKVREDLNEPFKHFDESYREALLNKDPLENGFPINNLIAGTRRDPLK